MNYKIKKHIKLMLNAMLGVFGLEIHRKPNAFHTRMKTLRTSLPDILDHVVCLGLVPNTVIDVGVGYGTPPLYSKFPEARHLLIEPLKEFECWMQDICKRCKAEYILAAAGPSAGEGEIGVSPDLVGSSMLRMGMERRRTPIITINDACRERNLKGPFLIKADVQGAELLVIEGAGEILSDTELVILETSFFSFHKGCPELFEVMRYMKEKGFVAFDFFSGHNRPLDGSRAQVDVAFVKENGMFRTSHDWAAPDQALAFYSGVKKRIHPGG